MIHSLTLFYLFKQFLKLVGFEPPIFGAGGYCSTSTVHGWVVKLKEYGLLRKASPFD